MIKTVDEFQSLIEELLRFTILCRDRMMNLSQSGHQTRRWFVFYDRARADRANGQANRNGECYTDNFGEHVDLMSAPYSLSSFSFTFTAASISS